MAFLNIPNSGSPTWREPVPTTGALPATGNNSGDVRVTLDTYSVYIWETSSWVLVVTPGAATPAGGSNGQIQYNNLGALAGASGITTNGTNLTVGGTISASNFSGSSSGTNTGDVTLGAFGSTPSATGFSLSGQALSGQPADATHPGGVSILSQTFAGNKTFNGNIAANGPGTYAIDLTGSTSHAIKFGDTSGAAEYYISGNAGSMFIGSGDGSMVLDVAGFYQIDFHNANGYFGDGTVQGSVFYTGGSRISIGNATGTDAWIDQDGSASFANGGMTIDSSGQIYAQTVNGFDYNANGGALTLYNDGSARFAAGAINFNTDGSASFVSGSATISAYGNFQGNNSSFGGIDLFDTGSYSSAGMDILSDRSHVPIVGLNYSGTANINFNTDGSATFLSGIYGGVSFYNSLGHPSMNVGDGSSYHMWFDPALNGIEIGDVNGIATISMGADTGSVYFQGAGYFSNNGDVSIGANTGTAAWIDSDGSAYFASQVSSASLVTGTIYNPFSVDVIELGTSGQINFDPGNTAIDIRFHDDKIIFGNGSSAGDGYFNGTLSAKGGAITIGSASGTSAWITTDEAYFANGGVTIDSSGNIVTIANITGDVFTGDGSGLTNISASSLTNSGKTFSYDAGNVAWVSGGGAGVFVDAGGLYGIGDSGNGYFQDVTALSYIGRAGTSGEEFKVGGRLYQNTTQATSSGTAETDLHSYTIVGNTFIATGNTVKFRSSGQFLASAFTKRVRVYLGGTLIFDSGALGITGSTDWVLDGEIVRSGSNTQKCNVNFSSSSATLAAYVKYTATSITDNASMILKTTGTEGTTGGSDVTEEMFHVDFEPGI